MCLLLEQVTVDRRGLLVLESRHEQYMWLVQKKGGETRSQVFDLKSGALHCIQGSYDIFDCAQLCSENLHFSHEP